MRFYDLALKASTYLASLAGIQHLMDPSSPSSTSAVSDGIRSAEGMGSHLMLSDRLTIQPSVSIFFSYARESELGQLFETEGSDVTVFAPTNRAVMALARKPHEGPVPVDDTVITQEEFDAQSKANVRAWISAHIVPQIIDDFSPPSTFQTLFPSVTIDVEMKSEDHVAEGKPNWANVMLNEKIGIVDKIEAANGVLYLVDEAIYG